MLVRIQSTVVTFVAALVFAIGTPASNALGQELDPKELLNVVQDIDAGANTEVEFEEYE